MFRLMMLLAGLYNLLLSQSGSQNLSLQIIIPEKIYTKASDNSKIETDHITYIIPIDGRPYNVHLKKRFILSDNFMVYIYNEGFVSSQYLDMQNQCYYQGYIEGYPNSIATLSTCSGIRGIIQFKNVSYGIEPLEADTEFKHILFKLKNDNKHPAAIKNFKGTEQGTSLGLHSYVESTLELNPLYLETYIVVDKALYDHLGANSMIVAKKVIEIISLVNTMFSQLKVTIVISSLELWSDNNKISTAGEADELLQRFLKWKNTYLTLRPHDIALLLIYRDTPDYVGTTIPGKMCVDHYSAAIALYPKKVTLEEFSVVVTQMLGHSLGMSYDDVSECQCPGTICIMNPEAKKFSGVKTFSSCSLNDFENFIINMGTKCLENRPQMQTRAAFCGNKVVESPEQCDCGTEEECGSNSCCNFKTCMLKSGAQCATGSCCKSDCTFQPAGFTCRPTRHAECDMPETCNGTSGECQPDITIHNGRPCKEGRYICYGGNCQDLDARCEALFGRGSQSAPFHCYEEINSQKDRFGNCGINNGQYVFCLWRNLICGRLICTYNSRVPYQKENTSVIYASIRDTICITLDYRQRMDEPDPMRVESGAICDTDRVCVNGICVESRNIKDEESACTRGCHGNGVCTSKKTCHCNSGFLPPDCRQASGKSGITWTEGLFSEKTVRRMEKKWWMICSYIVLPGLIIGIIVALSWDQWRKCLNKEEENLTTNKSEGSTDSYVSGSMSENTNKTDTSKFKSEFSAQTDDSKSKSEENLESSNNSEKIFLHVTVPKKIKSNESENPEKQVIYNITIDEKPLTLLLKKHSFLSNNFLVYTYNETGYLHYESKHFKRHCHYQGYIEDIPNSHASLNICSGLRGFIQYENLSYGIQPLELSARFEHIIYQMRIKNADNSMLAENDSYIWHKYQFSKVFLNSQKNIFPKLLPLYLEMHIIVEKALYEYLGSESMIVIQKIIQIIGLVNTIFSQFKLSVILSSLELWSDKNQISTNGEANNLLQRFLAWKNDSLILPQHDITLLLIYRKHPKYAGATIPRSICNNSYNADIAVYTDAVTLEEFSFIVFQILGIKIGLTDNDKNCIFSRAVCTMNYEAMYLSDLKTFSNDSMNAYKYFISKLEPKCLQKLSKNMSLYQTHQVCGNGILEHNEECDCGSKEECQFKMCCDYNTCKLKNSAKCGSGPCCTSKCEIAVAGTICRRSIDEECDFTEYCNGTSSNCVPDTYALNGKLCSLGAAYCYNGQCQTTDNQCTMIFGKGAQGAPYACFEEINFQQDEYRNCGFKNLQPLPCKQKDVLCGKLACVWPHKNIYKSDIQSVLYSYTQDYTCMSITTGSSLSSDGKDYAYVADGTVCGPNMYCLNRTCKEAQLTTYSCNATTKCKGNGICNNLGNCHCFPGYQPPYCELQIDSPGGSIDDGNIQKSGKFLNKGRAYQKNWLILSFYIVLPFFIIFIITIKKRLEKRKIMQQEDEDY